MAHAPETPKLPQGFLLILFKGQLNEGQPSVCDQVHIILWLVDGAQPLGVRRSGS